jgi:4-hydroxybenzoate polyprenyltransferase
VTYGLDGQPPALWSSFCFAIIGVSAHLANALPDLQSDTEAGMGGLAVRLGRRRSVLVCWTLLAAGTAVLAFVAAPSNALIAACLVIAYAGAVVIGSRSRRRSGMFSALICAVLVDVVAVVLVA